MELGDNHVCMARVAAGDVDHGEVADLFVRFLPLQVWGDRENVLYTLRERFRTPAALRAWVRDDVGAFIVQNMATASMSVVEHHGQ
jgi:hypothetical protein